jgi:chromosome segregation ATPase
MPDDLEPRVDLLERLAAQQLTLNDQLIASTQRLERAQFLHDAAQHRHSEMLDRHTETMTTLRDIQERQQRLLDTLAALVSQHGERMAELHALLAAIKDMLDRPNGH